MVKSVFEGTDYIKGWKESIKSIEDKLTALRAQSNAADFAASRQRELDNSHGHQFTWLTLFHHKKIDNISKERLA